MAQEIMVARESSVSSLNAQSRTTSAGRQANPFRNITTRPISEAYRRELEAEGVNMRIYESLRRDERDRRIDGELELQERNLRNSLREKYPLGNYASIPFTTDDKLLAKAQQQRKDYNRELARGIRRLRRLASNAKRK